MIQSGALLIRIRRESASASLALRLLYRLDEGDQHAQETALDFLSKPLALAVTAAMACGTACGGAGPMQQQEAGSGEAATAGTDVTVSAYIRNDGSYYCVVQANLANSSAPWGRSLTGCAFVEVEANVGTADWVVSVKWDDHVDTAQPTIFSSGVPGDPYVSSEECDSAALRSELFRGESGVPGSAYFVGEEIYKGHSDGTCQYPRLDVTISDDNVWYRITSEAYFNADYHRPLRVAFNPI
jgi:hypothetical protein